MMMPLCLCVCVVRVSKLKKICFFENEIEKKQQHYYNDEN